MPILFRASLPKEVDDDAEVLVWSGEGEASPDFSLSTAATAKRQVEYSTTRHALSLCFGQNDIGDYVRKDEHGKPFLASFLCHISLSHSNGVAAVVRAAKPTGVDVQQITEKMNIIAPRFMSEASLDCLSEVARLEHLHVFWGAKEAMYKAYGKRELNFKNHIFVQNFHYNAKGGECEGFIKKDNVFLGRFIIFYKKIKNYILVYVVEKQK